MQSSINRSRRLSERSLRDALPDCPGRVREVVGELVSEIRAVLKDGVEGIYLYGSLVAGDFNLEVSDIDLLVAVTSDVDEEQLGQLREMHDGFAEGHPAWNDRIDASYLSTDGLRTFKERESPIVVISPGEPIHRTETVPGWMMNWHSVREQGVTLFGPPPDAIIASTTDEDFLAAVRTHMEEMLGRAEQTRSPAFRAYAALTACRALYTASLGRQGSKSEAACWAVLHHPDWSSLIGDALDCRNSGWYKELDDEARERALEFVRFAVGELTCRSPVP